jgi:hypothetical protein
VKRRSCVLFVLVNYIKILQEKKWGWLLREKLVSYPVVQVTDTVCVSVLPSVVWAAMITL